MTKINLVVRELGRLKSEYSLDFDLPEVPRVGSYISVNRPNNPEPYSEDFIVRKVWWRLHHPETRPVITDNDIKTGTLTEIVVECDQALGPYSSDKWRDMLESAKAHGKEVEEFEIARFSVRQDALSSKE